MPEPTPKTDKQRFEEIRKSITEIGAKESAFIRIEQLFYEAINISRNYGNDVADNISILYGGSVKASNAKVIFSQADVDGGLVGGASLIAEEFIAIIKSLK